MSSRSFEFLSYAVHLCPFIGIRELSSIPLEHSGNGCLERIARCIEIAERLDHTTYDPVRRSFLGFLNDIAIADRFGKQV